MYAQSGKTFVLNTVLPAVLAQASIKASEIVVMRLNLNNMPCSQVRSGGFKSGGFKLGS